jgi:hypothetical protein
MSDRWQQHRSRGSLACAAVAIPPGHSQAHQREAPASTSWRSTESRPGHLSKQLVKHQRRKSNVRDRLQAAVRNACSQPSGLFPCPNQGRSHRQPVLSTKLVRIPRPGMHTSWTRKRSAARVSAAQGPFVVGDTGIEPVTHSVSGINTVLSTPPLSTKTVRGHPLTSPCIRDCCHAISQSPQPNT